LIAGASTVHGVIASKIGPSDAKIATIEKLDHPRVRERERERETEREREREREREGQRERERQRQRERDRDRDRDREAERVVRKRERERDKTYVADPIAKTMSVNQTMMVVEVAQSFFWQD
jgi:hypothetical protein